MLGLVINALAEGQAVAVLLAEAVEVGAVLDVGVIRGPELVDERVYAPEGKTMCAVILIIF